MALDDVFDYFKRYDKQVFEVVACHGNEPAEADVAAFEGVIGFRLPDEFREFTMSGLGGMYMAVREQLWPRTKAFDVGPFWSFLYGIKVFGIAEGIPDWLDIRQQHQRSERDGFGDLVPFLQRVGDADRFCFDKAGRIVRWSHEEPDAREQEPLTFSGLLMREVSELERRKDRKLALGKP